MVIACNLKPPFGGASFLAAWGWMRLEQTTSRTRPEGSQPLVFVFFRPFCPPGVSSILVTLRFQASDPIMPDKTTPTRLTVSLEAQTLTIEWADGHRSVYPLDGLRRACPSATCMGGHANMGTLPDPEVLTAPPRRRWEQLKLEPVGNYGLRLIWDDGHDTGIHTWQRLRAICPRARSA
jgi:DUF971 family protein